MWKGRAVIGGEVGGIRHQIERHFLMTRLLEDWLDAIASFAGTSARRSLPRELATSA
jgi:hypothetical protein